MAQPQGHVNFDAPNGNWLERLYEWLQHNPQIHISLDCENIGTPAVPVWRATPQVGDETNTTPIPQCAGEGPSKQAAKGEAARRLSTWVFEE
ncbi:hypothetical protein FRC09_014117 [Ceratobasidium sp. 395]|nr:hypothetical protein FRC09_014117 [Ceratobasidium sp. 395]